MTLGAPIYLIGAFLGELAILAIGLVSGVLRWDAMHWDAMHWDAMHWDAMHWDAMRWDAMRSPKPAAFALATPSSLELALVL